MTTLSPNSPIGCLNTDILWYIMKINADRLFDDDTALETTVSTSHVCRAWRTFMLNIPSIWAHLIDLDVLHGSDDEWRNELLRRSGRVLLWIKARRCTIHVIPDPISCTKQVFNFIGENWIRIQKLEATFDEKYVDRQWKPLYLPAPHMESLSLIFSRRTYNYTSQLSFPMLFGGSSPLLREFCAKDFNSNPSGPWLHSIQSLQLNAKLTVRGTLELLKLTKNLVNLLLHNTANRDETWSSPLPLVELPNLRHFTYNHFDKLKAGIALLDHVQIPPDCSVEFLAKLFQIGGMVSEVDTLPFARKISTYAQGFFNHHKPTKMLLRYSSTNFVFEARTCASTSIFKISIILSSANIFKHPALGILLNELSQLDFSNVTEFTFTFNVTHIVPELSAFFICLSSTCIIETDVWSLGHLVQAEESSKIADTQHIISLPMVNTLKLSSLPDSFLKDARNHLSKFILPRIALGYAIDTLDLTQGSRDVPPDMTWLAKVDGLKVLWKRSGSTETLEYVCGADNRSQ